MSETAGRDPRQPGLPQPAASLQRLADVMHRLRRECPWDAQQTHESLVQYLIEETAEVVEAIEDADAGDLREELGDLLLQVYFHAELAAEQGRFDLAQVADAIADKLIGRHPHVFGDEDAPDDLDATWEARKKAEKGRRSALDGIALTAPVARANKVIARTRSHGLELDLPAEPVGDEVGTEILALIARAHASGIDADQSLRAALRALETRVVEAES
ncbi:nucleoside triphosphate pyrophosphohydrolase [Parenemella sanctibonifatiensis]|uniref:Nucleoside triphosphate pyrophosphohydrolase n=1 Tax=Parenemella sanctibonifatiensis TaxID=2016505 RepID=A0A255EG23_9ACTN|nr:nucleoside triphosphate pyrophosphohydrolase [Parenemella sanctibonifatiensis]